MSNVISRRLKRAINKCGLLPNNIMAYQRGKSPVEAVSYLKDIISVADTNSTKYTLLIADLEAAYDRIHKNYIITLLYKMNFPQSFIKTLELLIYNNKALLAINDSQEGVIDLRSGLVQGCMLTCWVSLYSILELATRKIKSIAININKKAHFKENKNLILENLPPIFLQMTLEVF